MRIASGALHLIIQSCQNIDGYKTMPNSANASALRVIDTNSRHIRQAPSARHHALPIAGGFSVH